MCVQTDTPSQLSFTALCLYPDVVSHTYHCLHIFCETIILALVGKSVNSNTAMCLPSYIPQLQARQVCLGCHQATKLGGKTFTNG